MCVLGIELSPLKEQKVLLTTGPGPSLQSLPWFLENTEFSTRTAEHTAQASLRSWLTSSQITRCYYFQWRENQGGLSSPESPKATQPAEQPHLAMALPVRGSWFFNSKRTRPSLLAAATSESRVYCQERICSFLWRPKPRGMGSGWARP